MAITVDVDRTSTDFVQAFDGSVDKMLMDAATIGFNWCIEQAPEDRGTLKQTAIAPEKRSDGSVVWGFSQPYSAAQEFGTPPFTPPIEPLLEWGERVGIGRSGGAKVWQKIREEGIEEKRFVRDGRDRQVQRLKGADFGEIFEGELEDA